MTSQPPGMWQSGITRVPLLRRESSPLRKRLQIMILFSIVGRFRDVLDWGTDLNTCWQCRDSSASLKCECDQILTVQFVRAMLA